MYTNPLSKPTASQQTWQSQYDTLRLQQAAYKAQVLLWGSE